MRTSDQLDQLAAALVAARGAMKNAALNKVNPHFKSKFADLTSVIDATTAALKAHGLVVTQAPDVTEQGPVLVTRLLHGSGQWMETHCPLPVVSDMQKMGSAITYARRYSLSAICGIAADEDDDANGAVETQREDAKLGEWLTDLEATADEGSAKLLASVKSSSETFRDALRSRPDTWKRLKAKAEAADKKLVAA
mgnify:CR=1